MDAGFSYDAFRKEFLWSRSRTELNKGVKLNIEHTNKIHDLPLQENQLEQAESFKYLEYLIENEGIINNEVNDRMGKQDAC